MQSSFPSKASASRSILGKCVAAMALLAIVSARPAHAYLDPMSGSIILQVVLGGLAGFAVLVRLFFRKLRSFFRLDARQDQETP
jgi:hypothetical protein